MVISFSPNIEGVVLTEVAHPIKMFLVLISHFLYLFPGSPLLHYSEKFNFVVCGLNELLYETTSNFLLNLANILSLINYLHAISGLLPTVYLVAILVW